LLFIARFCYYATAMINVDITIVGAGVVGLAVACAVSESQKNVVIIDKESGPGCGISSRHSEVIHAGIYYPVGSLKTNLCIKGSSLIYDFCLNHDIPCKQVGKVIVAATQAEEQSIESLWRLGNENGAQGLQMLTTSELRIREPHVQGSCAIFSPHTGIIDSHRLIKTLELMALDRGCTIIYNTLLDAIDVDKHGFICSVEGKSQHRYKFMSRSLINAAGLNCDEVASLAGIDVDDAGYRIYPVKGQYFRVRGKKGRLINGLVYPSPEKRLTGLGIHLTKDLTGSVRLGPDARYVKKIDYDVDPAHAAEFLESTRRLLPFLDEEDIIPDMAGIRPKIQPQGGDVRDFVICHEENRGLFGLINLIGIESPGLTSCLAIGEKVKSMMKDAGLY